jgi:L-ribulose-5-phosphate 3-epimerase
VSARDRICAIGDEAAADLEGQVAAHRRAGLRALELRTLDGRFLHELRAAEARRAADALAAAALTVPVVDTPIGSWSVSVATDMQDELRVLRTTAQRARALGCRRLRVMSYPSDGRAYGDWRREALRRMRLLADAAEELDVVLLHENCHGWAAESPEAAIDMLATVDSPALRLLFDTGNGLAYGYEAPVYLQAVLPWVEHVHIKDGLRARGLEGPQYTLAGAGEAGVAVCCEMLARAGFRGWFSLEPHLGVIPHEGFDAGPEGRQQAHRASVAAFERVLGDVLARVDRRAQEKAA